MCKVPPFSTLPSVRIHHSLGGGGEKQQAEGQLPGDRENENEHEHLCSLCKLSSSLSGFCLLLVPHLPEVPGSSDSKAFRGLHNKKGHVPH